MKTDNELMKEFRFGRVLAKEFDGVKVFIKSSLKVDEILTIVKDTNDFNEHLFFESVEPCDEFSKMLLRSLSKIESDIFSSDCQGYSRKLRNKKQQIKESLTDTSIYKYVDSMSLITVMSMIIIVREGDIKLDELKEIVIEWLNK